MLEQQVSELALYWAKKLWSIRPLAEPFVSDRGFIHTHGLYDDNGDLQAADEEFPIRVLFDNLVRWAGHRRVSYDTDLSLAQEVIEYVVTNDSDVVVKIEAHFTPSGVLWFVTARNENYSMTAVCNSAAKAVCTVCQKWVENVETAVAQEVEGDAHDSL